MTQTDGDRFTEFYRYISKFGRFAWSLLYVEREIDEVATVYRDIVGGNLKYDVPIVASDGSDRSGRIAIIAERASPWTMIIRSIGLWCNAHADELSSRIGCRVVNYGAEDTSGYELIQLFDSGRRTIEYRTPDVHDLVEGTEAASGDATTESVEIVVTERYDKVFTHYEIPMIRAVPHRDALAVMQEDMYRVVRSHLLIEVPIAEAPYVRRH